jgi:hypothetical protein
MSDGGVGPQGESIRQALRWLDEQAQPDRTKLVAEAARRFDLTPLEEDFLLGSWARPSR